MSSFPDQPLHISSESFVSDSLNLKLLTSISAVLKGTVTGIHGAESWDMMNLWGDEWSEIKGRSVSTFENGVSHSTSITPHQPQCYKFLNDSSVCLCRVRKNCLALVNVFTFLEGLSNLILTTVLYEMTRKVVVLCFYVRGLGAGFQGHIAGQWSKWERIHSAADELACCFYPIWYLWQ